jgi:formylglycine-generating enzyme required for sulfatase activity
MNDVLAEPFGWGVAKRYEFAKTIGRRSVGGPEANRLWSEAIEAIRRLPRYGGLAIESQLGLLPIGMDVDSGLWEFAHLQTGDAAVRGADGKLVLTEQTGLVFVLIPGGSCWLGAQSVDPNAENFDERSLLSEGPTSRGTLSPFLVSKFETTQGQWRRIMAVNASRMSPNSPLSPVLISFNDEEAAFGDLHPAENISYYDIQAFCRATALLIPTHTEWEYMARAHTNSPWWTGDAESQVSRGGNIADADARIRARQLIPTWSYSDSVHDGSAFVCRIGKYDSNPFGIHDTIGNVFEWCRDETEAIQEPRQAQPVSAGRRSAGARGGSWFSVCDAARVTYRLELDPAFRFEIVGFRPAIRLK